jgi:hypothetical protein
MNMKQLIARQESANVKFEVAKRIREVLDEARKAYGPQAWDDADIESEISELVFSE